MIQLTPHMRILLHVEPIDFRKGIDGMAAVCRKALCADPLNGSLFVFINRSRSAIKLLSYDGQGMWLMHKRLSQGKFRWWPRAGEQKVARELAVHELQLLLWNGDLQSAVTEPMWRPLRQNSP